MFTYRFIEFTIAHHIKERRKCLARNKRRLARHFGDCRAHVKSAWRQVFVEAFPAGDGCPIPPRPAKTSLHLSEVSPADQRTNERSLRQGIADGNFCTRS